MVKQRHAAMTSARTVLSRVLRSAMRFMSVCTPGTMPTYCVREAPARPMARPWLASRSLVLEACLCSAEQGKTVLWRGIHCTMRKHVPALQ